MTIQSLIKSDIEQRTDLIAIARSGIEVRYIKNIQDFTSLSENELVSILPISHRQLMRYDDKHRLNKEITSHIILIIQLFQKGYRIFGKEKFRLWIRTMNNVLDRNKPMDIMDTSIGIEMIEDVLGRIEQGVYS